jgi:hypothetical protein
MAQDEKQQRKDTRPDRGTRPIGAIVPTVTRDAFRRISPGVAQLIEAWAGIVGPALADTTIPRSLAHGTLTIGCSGPVAMELQHLSIQLLARINQYLGTQMVRRLRFVQTHAGRPLPRPIQRPDASAEIVSSKAVAHLPEGPLRDALAALGRAVLTESTSRPSRNDQR